MYINPRHLVLGGTAVAGATVGGLVGYQIAAKRYINYFDQQLEKEMEATVEILESRINTLEDQLKAVANPPQDLADVVGDEIKDDMAKQLLEKATTAHIQYNKMNKTTPKDVAEALQTLSSIGHPDEVVVVEDGVAVEVTAENVFERDGVHEDPLDKENRNPMIPYVIDEDEFGTNEYEHDQSSFVYYEGDDILTDQRDEVVADVEETVGEDNLTRFGVGSRNPNVVHVRNERLGLDFEITRVEGRYSEVAAGFIRHSQDRHEPRRFRGEYE